MLKRIVKIVLMLIVAVIVAAGAFIITLQVTEFNPAATETLDVRPQPLSSYFPVDVPEDVTITIMTWNTGYASLSETEDFVMDGGVKARMDSLTEVEGNIDGIADVLGDVAADIYLLQEVDEGSDRSYGTLQASTYAERLSRPSVYGINYRCLFVPFPFEFGQMMGKVESGILTVSDYTIEEATRHQLPGAFAWPIRLANLKRCMVVSRLPIAGSDRYLVLVNVHLSAYDDGTMRLQEMEALKTLVAAEYEAGNFVVVGGDFNQTFPPAVAYDADLEPTYHFALRDPSLWEAFGMDGTWFDANGWQYGIDMTTPTCRLLDKPFDAVDDANNQYYLIDGFIVSPNVTIESVTTLDLDFQYSDHNPVVITIRIIL